MQLPLLLTLLTLALPGFAAPSASFRHTVPLREMPASEPAPVNPLRSSALRDFDLQPASFTPYDRYLGSVRGVLASLDFRSPSVAEACRLLRIAHAFRYVTRDPYRADPPSLTASRRAGDCKAKALWLYDRLGDPNALYVIGKISARAKASHAWLYWRWEDHWWILDPTNLSNPIAADSVGRHRYVPYYSFTRGAAYRHPATHLLLFAQNTSASAVAARR